MKQFVKLPPDTSFEIRLLTRKEVAELLRVSSRTVEEQTKRWEQYNASADEIHPSSPNHGLRPTRVTTKTVFYDMRDIREYLSNARREQEGKSPTSSLGVES